MQRKPGYYVGVFLIGVYCLVFLLLIGLALTGENSGAMATYALVWGILSAVLFIPLTVLVMRAKYLPEQRSTATLCRKCVRVSDPGGEQEALRFQLTFGFPNGSAMVFEVPRWVFDALQENQTGILTYKAKGRTTFFIRFDCQ